MIMTCEEFELASQNSHLSTNPLIRGHTQIRASYRIQHRWGVDDEDQVSHRRTRRAARNIVPPLPEFQSLDSLCFQSPIHSSRYRRLFRRELLKKMLELSKGGIRNLVLPGRFMIGQGCAKGPVRGFEYGVANPSRLCVETQFRRCWSSRLPIVVLNLFYLASSKKAGLWRSMLAGFKWVRAEIRLDSQSDLAKPSTRLADDNFPSLRAS